MKLFYGVGVNDKTRPTTDNGRLIRQYKLWTTMLQRCYDHKFQQKQRSYIGYEVSTNFLSYSFFYDWCCMEYGFDVKDSDGRLWQLDKDLLNYGNKLYSEDTCCFVPAKLNMLLQVGKGRSNNLPCGVVLQGSKYQAQCSVNGKAVYLGIFKTEGDAYEAYKNFKSLLIKKFTFENFNYFSDKHITGLINYKL
jgi:hypothetical protein